MNGSNSTPPDSAGEQPTQQVTAPRITVAMPIFNAGAYLRMAVRSIQIQTFVDWELLIIDDGSTDNALADITDLADPRIRVLRDGRNRGLAARLNEAIDRAQGTYFARMDQDDIAYPERFARQVAMLEQDPRLDIVATRAITIDGNNVAVGTFPYRDRHETIIAQPWIGFHFPHPTWMGRLEWFRRHRYAEPAPYFCEDQELLLRSYPVSCFGTLSDVLFAYRVRKQFNPEKQFKTRKALWRVQCAQFRARRQWRYLLLSTLVLAIRLLSDAVRRLSWRSGIQLRTASLAGPLVARWQVVSTMVCADTVKAK